VKLLGSDDALDVELRTVGADAVATGTLQRQEQSGLEAAAATIDAAADEAADAAAADALAYDAAGLCPEADSPIDFGQAAGEGWYERGDPIRLYGLRFVKQGRSRVLKVEDMVQYGTYADASVFVPVGEENDDNEVVYVLVGPAGGARDGDTCEFQGYEPEG